MMSPYFSPERSDCAIPREIIAIHQEISKIDLHRTEHAMGYGKIKQLDQSCKYCQPYIHSEVVQTLVEPAAPEFRTREKNSNCDCKASAKRNTLERTVDAAGKKGQIVVPRSWAGKRVRVTLL